MRNEDRTNRYCDGKATPGGDEHFATTPPAISDRRPVRPLKKGRRSTQVRALKAVRDESRRIAAVELLEKVLSRRSRRRPSTVSVRGPGKGHPSTWDASTAVSVATNNS